VVQVELPPLHQFISLNASGASVLSRRITP
jgi:hypothetical protein